MDTGIIILIVVVVLVVLAVAAVVSRRGRGQRHEVKRQEAREIRREAEVDRAEADRTRAEADERAARARGEHATAREQAAVADAQREDARDRHVEAARIDPDGDERKAGESFDRGPAQRSESPREGDVPREERPR